MSRHLFVTASLLLCTGAHAADPTQTFLRTPNFPLNAPLPVNPGAMPGYDLQLEPGSTNVLWLLMGTRLPFANLKTSQSIRDTFFMNYIVGDLNQAIGEPADTAHSYGSAPFYAVARHYAVGDPNDLHVMRPRGMALRAICSGDHADCAPGNVYGAMIRLPFEIRPGMTVEVRYRSPRGPHSWAPIWMLSGSQTSPGPGGSPYSGYGTPLALVQLPQYRHMFEIDLNDNMPVWDRSPGAAIGHQLLFGTPDIYGVPRNVAPHLTFEANTDGFKYVPSGGPPFIRVPENWSTRFHTLTMSWDGAYNTIYEFVDGTLVASAYMEYSLAPTYVDASGARKVQAMHLMIGNQAIPFSLPGSSTVTENDGIPDGWTITVQEIAAWNGIVSDPLSYAPAGATGFIGSAVVQE